MNKCKGKEKLMEIIFLIAACISIISVVLICIFLFMNGIPAMKKIGFGDFIFGQRWRPGNNIFGIWPMILGSIYVTVGAIPPVNYLYKYAKIRHSVSVNKTL